MIIRIHDLQIKPLHAHIVNWEPEERYHHRLCIVIAPFWFSTDNMFVYSMPVDWSFANMHKDFKEMFWLFAYVSGCKGCLPILVQEVVKKKVISILFDTFIVCTSHSHSMNAVVPLTCIPLQMRPPKKLLCCPHPTKIWKLGRSVDFLFIFYFFLYRERVEFSNIFKKVSKWGKLGRNAVKTHIQVLF